MMKRVAATFLASIACVCVGLGQARAELISLDMSKLPSAQGWTYSAQGNAASENSVFSVSGGLLHQNTLGVGFGAFGGGNEYDMITSFDPTRPFTIEIQARVLQEEGNFTGGPPPGIGNAGGFQFSLFDAQGFYHIGIGVDRIQTGNGFFDNPSNVISTPFDTTIFHDYLLAGDGSGKFTLYVDGVQFLNDTINSNFATGISRLSFGDGTGGVNAQADVASYTFRQSVPEPTGLTLAVIGAFSVFVSRNRRQRSAIRL